MKKRLAITLALAGMSAAATAQEIKISNPKPSVSQEITVQLDREPDHNQSITWIVQSGVGAFVGDVTQQKATFRTGTTPGAVVIVCLIKSERDERRPTASLTVSGPAQAQAQTPATQPTATKPTPAKNQAPTPAATGSIAQTGRGLLALEDMELVVPAGWMGDAMSENNATALLDPGHTNGCRSHRSCYRVEYRPGKAGWAAFAWQRVPEGSMNWGEYPGLDLSHGNYQSLRLWARGDFSASGGTAPKAQFKSGGNVAPNFSKTNPASYSVAGPTVELTEGFKEYCLDLKGKDQTNVVSPFTVVVTRASNPKNAVIIIDDVVFSTSACAR